MQVTSLFALLDLRFALMKAVADYKRVYGLPIGDKNREQALLTHLSDQVRQISETERPHFSTAAVENFFQLQMDLAKQIQQEILQSKMVIPKWARGLDLHTQLRPTLTQVSRRIIQSIHQLPHQTFSQQQLERWAQRELTTKQLSPQEKQAIGTTLWQVISVQ